MTSKLKSSISWSQESCIVKSTSLYNNDPTNAYIKFSCSFSFVQSLFKLCGGGGVLLLNKTVMCTASLPG